MSNLFNMNYGHYKSNATNPQVSNLTLKGPSRNLKIGQFPLIRFDGNSLFVLNNSGPPSTLQLGLLRHVVGDPLRVVGDPLPVVGDPLHQDLSYDESLSDQPGAWLVKKLFFYMHAITKTLEKTSY